MNRVWANTAWKLFSLIGTKLFTFVFVLLAARWLGLDDFGYLMFALAYAHIAFVLVDAGVSTALWREASTADDKGLRGYLSAHLLRPYTEIIGLGLVLLGLALFDLPPEAQFLAILVGLGVGIDALINLDLAVFKAQERLRSEALVTLLGKGVFVALAIAAIRTGCGLVGVGIAYLAGHILALVFSRHQVSFIGPPISQDGPQPVPLLRQALPLAAVSLFTVVYFRIDLVMLQGITGAEAAGLYGAAYRLVEAAMILPAAFLTAIFPRLARISEGNEDEELVRSVLKTLVYVATAGVVFGLVFAPEVLALLFGEPFREAAAGLRILLLALWFIYPNYLLTHLLIAHRRQNAYARIVGLCALLNVALNALLIPLLGLIGAAIATVLTEGLLLVFAWRQLRDRIDLLTLQNLTYPIHYGAVLLVLLLVTKAISLNFAAAAGGAIMLLWSGIALWSFHRQEMV
ncbi:MAG: flippase [Alphaproteobacteria bacterium]